MSEQRKELRVSAIENGTVIDHIPSEKLFLVIKILGLDNFDSPITFGSNLDSKKLGKKGIIKVSNKFFKDDEVRKIALAAPKATLIVIKNFEIIEKKPVQLPDSFTGIVKCVNPKCITNQQNVEQKFQIIDKEDLKLHCVYCEKFTKKENFEFLSIFKEMKKIFLFAGMAIFIGCIFLVACSKDNVTEILPNANVVLKDGSTLIDSINMGTVAGTKKGEMILITGTKIISADERKMLVYIDGKDDGSYPVNISPNSLLSFNLTDIKTSTVIYYVSKDEYYLLVEGEITLTNTQKSMMSGTFNGKVIPAHELTSDVSLETILLWYDAHVNLTGDFRTYSVRL
jgi:aspartate carbamoyltransferase regulatory subunit